ncbi:MULTISPECIES: hypothetical protein [Rhizobium]|uniref:hypothetical protein n=1 Tax=Rhizobium TaxID=379 RepID=UPI000401AD9F|nr:MULTISPECIES: hypothetical protein [Rhizobium]UFS81532.1 hypothetical protein LPB79_24995 [Rhizobium sp. T136]
MAARKPKLETVVPVIAASEQAPMTYITNPVTTAGQTPRTRDDIALRDAIRARLAVIEKVIFEFVAEKEADGFCRADIDQLYAVELPLLLGYRNDGGRFRVSYDASIVERAS